MGKKTGFRVFFTVSLVSLQKSMAFYAFFTLKPRVFLSFCSHSFGKVMVSRFLQPSGDSRRSSRGHPLVLQEETVPVGAPKSLTKHAGLGGGKSWKPHKATQKKPNGPSWRSDFCSKNCQNSGIHSVLWPKKTGCMTYSKSLKVS